MELKINIFSNEHAIFHLHKNRNFIEKLTRPVEEQKNATEIVNEVK